MPGVSDNVAQTLIAEIGAGMSAFPTADHLVSWAGMCRASTRAQAENVRGVSAKARHG